MNEFIQVEDILIRVSSIEALFYKDTSLGGKYYTYTILRTTSGKEFQFKGDIFQNIIRRIEEVEQFKNSQQIEGKPT